MKYMLYRERADMPGFTEKIIPYASVEAAKVAIKKGIDAGRHLNAAAYIVKQGRKVVYEHRFDR